MQQADPLIRTKLRMPFTQPALVPRPLLQAEIARGLRGPLTLITAPAGFGKTTLAAASVAASAMPVAWLSLDKHDNQVERFLHYLIAALHEADPTLGVEAAQLAAAQPALPTAFLTSLINDLDAAGRAMVLVLDDYQFVQSPAVHEAVAFLLEHCPRSLHILIATRADPPLPLARLRAHGQTVELRAAALCFTQAEAAQFLNEVMGLRLDAEPIALLTARTEGWVAGLQMAALSMRERTDVAGFVQGFSGTHRYILDYLLEEVLAVQPPAVQRFLLSTAVLERLSAPLCAAVLVDALDDGAAADADTVQAAPLRLRQAAHMLAYLEQANLFLTPLDDARRWYRYHSLFADLLRAQLTTSPYAQQETELHARASAWYAAHDFPDEAIHHALAAGDAAGAARLADAAAASALLNGQYAHILAWTEALPAAIVHSHPWLCIWNAWVYTQIGAPQAISQWIETARSAAGEAADAQAVMDEIAALQVFAVSFVHEYERAIALAEAVLNQPPHNHTQASPFIRCNILHLLSSMYFATGQLRAAAARCEETIALARTIGFTLRFLHASNKLILIHQTTGDLARAAQMLEASWAHLQEQEQSNYFAAAQLHFRRIDLLYEWNRLEEAQQLLDWALARKLTVEVPYLQVDLCNVRALLLLARQDYSGAQDALDQAAALAHQTYIWEGLTGRTAWLQLRLWLQQGDLARVAAWAGPAPAAALAADASPPADEVRTLAQAQVLLAQGAHRAALVLLDQLAAAAGAGGRTRSLIEIEALTALAWQRAGEVGQAAVAVERALALAAPTGHVRTLLDAGQPLRLLLARWLAHAAPGPLRDHAVRLLAHFGAEPQTDAAAQPTAPNGGLIEPLTPRELEVLHLMAQGATNQGIASQLIISLGTVKAHTASIYRKLDVANRTEAVAHARRRGILT